MTELIRGFASKAVHAGHTPDAATHSRAVPLYQTSSFTFDSTQHAAATANSDHAASVGILVQRE